MAMSAARSDSGSAAAMARAMFGKPASQSWQS